MNLSERKLLIDEDEIRSALKQYRPNKDLFAENVRSRMSVGGFRLQSDCHSTSAGKKSLGIIDSNRKEWIRVAASFLPVQVLSSGINPLSFGAISLGKKVVVALAFPFLCFLMISMTVYGVVQIRLAKRNHASTNRDANEVQQATMQWWTRYRSLAAIVFALTIVATFLGWTTPIMIALVASGIAGVSMVHTLARQGLLERSAIGGASVAMLALLGQLSSSFANRNSEQVLDPLLSTGVLFGGAFSIAALLQWKRSPLTTNFGAMHLCFILALAFVTICSQSLWNKTTRSDIQEFVNSSAGMQLGTREIWEYAAQWLNETDGGFDKHFADQHLQQQLESQHKLWWLTSAIRAGLVTGSELPMLAEMKRANREIDPDFAQAHFTALEHDYANIVALVESGSLDSKGREVLLSRLMKTWEITVSSDYKRLRSLVLLTELIDRLAPKFERELRKANVQRSLTERQVIKPIMFGRSGGFYSTRRSIDSDQDETLSAIELMSKYGIPPSIDIPKLNSYLRPSSLFDFHAYTFVPKMVAREKLVHLPDFPEHSALSYLKSEKMLWMSILLVILLAFATLSSPSGNASDVSVSHLVVHEVQQEEPK